MKRVGRSNKPGINEAAQAVGKNSQNILDARALVIQRSSEEVTGKVQKYARMDARQFVPYSSRDEGYLIRDFCRRYIPGFGFFFILGGLLGLVCEKFRDAGNVANLKNIIWSISTVWQEYLLLSVN